MDGTDIVQEVMKLGLTGASILANILLYRRMDTAETKFDSLQQTRVDEKDAMLKQLLSNSKES